MAEETFHCLGPICRYFPYWWTTLNTIFTIHQTYLTDAIYTTLLRWNCITKAHYIRLEVFRFFLSLSCAELLKSLWFLMHFCLFNRAPWNCSVTSLLAKFVAARMINNLCGYVNIAGHDIITCDLSCFMFDKNEITAFLTGHKSSNY